MKQMDIEKTIELHREFEAAKDLSCELKLDYTAEKKGIRAYGLLYVKGQGLRNNLSFPFSEEIELDILAPYNKLDCKNAFEVLLTSWQGELQNDVLELSLHFQLNGLIDEEDEMEEQINKDILIEDLLDDEENLKEVQHFVIALQNDSYQSIAERYHVSEKELMIKNKNKLVEYKSLILLP